MREYFLTKAVIFIFLIASSKILASDSFRQKALLVELDEQNMEAKFTVGIPLGSGLSGKVYALEPENPEHPPLAIKIFLKKNSIAIELERELNSALYSEGLTKIVFYNGKFVQSVPEGTKFQIKSRLFGRDLKWSDMMSYSHDPLSISGHALKFSVIAQRFRDLIVALDRAELEIDGLHKGNVFLCDDGKLEIVDGFLTPYRPGGKTIILNGQIAFAPIEEKHEYIRFVEKFFPEIILDPKLQALVLERKLADRIFRELYDFFLADMYAFDDYEFYFRGQYNLMNLCKYNRITLISMYGKNQAGICNYSTLSTENWMKDEIKYANFMRKHEELELPMFYLLTGPSEGSNEGFEILGRCCIWPDGSIEYL